MNTIRLLNKHLIKDISNMVIQYITPIHQILEEFCITGYCEKVSDMMQIEEKFLKLSKNNGLRNACRIGDRGMIDLLIHDTCYSCGLLGACANGNMELIQYIISIAGEHKFELDYFIGLEGACLSGNIDVVNYILKKTSIQQAHRFVYEEALHAAGYAGNMDIINVILKEAIIESIRDYYGTSWFDKHDSIEILMQTPKQLLQLMNIDNNLYYDTIHNVLTGVSQGGHLDIAIFLLDYAPHYIGLLFEFGCIYNQLHMAQYALTHGYKPSSDDIGCVLYETLNYGFVNVFQFILDIGYYIDLDYALLITVISSKNIYNNNIDDYIHTACRCNNIYEYGFILEYDNYKYPKNKANQHIDTDSLNNLPINYSEVCKLLINLGAKPCPPGCNEIHKIL